MELRLRQLLNILGKQEGQIRPNLWALKSLINSLRLLHYHSFNVKIAPLYLEVSRIRFLKISQNLAAQCNSYLSNNKINRKQTIVGAVKLLIIKDTCITNNKMILQL
jgi:hypothetical protein